MFTGTSRPGGVGDNITAALFAGLNQRDGDSLGAFGRLTLPAVDTACDVASRSDLVHDTQHGPEPGEVQSELVHAT